MMVIRTKRPTTTMTLLPSTVREFCFIDICEVVCNCRI
jgi:hypothetical protein